MEISTIFQSLRMGLPKLMKALSTIATTMAPNPLSIFVRGTSPHARASAHLGAFGPMQIRHPDPSNTAAILFPSLDLLGFVGLLLSLLAIAFGAGSWLFFEKLLATQLPKGFLS
jgi:hypothetical protein